MFAIYNDIMGSIEILLLMIIAFTALIAVYIMSVGNIIWTLLLGLYIYFGTADLFVEFYNTIANEHL